MRGAEVVSVFDVALFLRLRWSGGRRFRGLRWRREEERELIPDAVFC